MIGRTCYTKPMQRLIYMPMNKPLDGQVYMPSMLNRTKQKYEHFYNLLCSGYRFSSVKKPPAMPTENQKTL